MNQQYLRNKVKADSVSDFLERYYKPDRYHGRGESYAQSLLESYEQEFAKHGFCFISYHDSVTGRIVAFCGNNEEGRE